MFGTALLDEDDIARFQNTAKQFSLEQEEELGADLSLARPASQHEKGRVGGSLSGVEARDAKFYFTFSVAFSQDELRES